MNENNELAKRQLQSGWHWVQTDLLVAVKPPECLCCEAQAVSWKHLCMWEKPKDVSLNLHENLCSTFRTLFAQQAECGHIHTGPNANPFNPDLPQKKARLAMRQRHFPMHKARASHPWLISIKLHGFNQRSLIRPPIKASCGFWNLRACHDWIKIWKHTKWNWFTAECAPHDSWVERQSRGK